MKTQTATRKHSLAQTVCSFFLLLFLGLGAQNLQAQSTPVQNGERTVTGVVQTPHGPLPYVSITLKGTQIGVLTDENGAFIFPKPLKENDILVVSSLAYEDQEFTITGDTAYIEPLLEGIEIVIVGALRTKPAHASKIHD